MNTRTNDIARCIDIWSAYRGLAPTDVWTQLGWTKQRFYNKKRGVSAWTIGELDELAAVLNIGTADLLRDPSDLLKTPSTWMGVAA